MASNSTITIVFKDYMEVLQSVNSVSKGFGVSAEEAMRMIKDGNSRYIFLGARRGC